ncbi:MAG: radical SAM protein [Candidatus Aenigmarchaeota archaeon]|nr:radical SAM protein [Candidatus Aenigmarchaeota archaeon]
MNTLLDSFEISKGEKTFFTILPNGKTLLTTEFGSWIIGEEDEIEELIKRKKCKTKLFEKKFFFSSPKLFILKLTRDCNFNCQYCHSVTEKFGANNTRMDFETAAKIIDYIINETNEQGKIRIEFQGGEPLLEWDLIKRTLEYTIERFRDLERETPNFSFSTNGSLLSENIIREIKEFQEKVNLGLSISFDGDEEVTEITRPYKNGNSSYSKVRKKIELLNEERIDYGTITLITRESLGKEKGIIENLRSLGLKKSYFLPVLPFGRILENPKLYDKFILSPKETRLFFERVLNHCIKIWKKGDFFFDRTLFSYFNNLRSLDREYMCLRRPCGAMRSIFVFDNKGRIFGCDGGNLLDEMYFGNIESVHIRDVFRKKSPVMNQAYYWFDNCNDCPFQAFCGICTSRVISHSKLFSKKYSEKYECSLNKEMFSLVFETLMDKEKFDTCKEILDNYIL